MLSKKCLGGGGEGAMDGLCTLLRRYSDIIPRVGLPVPVLSMV